MNGVGGSTKKGYQRKRCLFWDPFHNFKHRRIINLSLSIKKKTTYMHGRTLTVPKCPERLHRSSFSGFQLQRFRSMRGHFQTLLATWHNKVPRLKNTKASLYLTVGHMHRCEETQTSKVQKNKGDTKKYRKRKNTSKKQLSQQRCSLFL